VAYSTNIGVIFDSGPFTPLSENMTSFTKPEVHNVLHCRQRRTEPLPQLTCTDDLLKFERVLFSDTLANTQIGRQTYRHALYVTSY